MSYIIKILVGKFLLLSIYTFSSNSVAFTLLSKLMADLLLITKIRNSVILFSLILEPLKISVDLSLKLEG